MNAVVLSGGGAAGAYQIGVWKALRKIGYKYDIVCGTSVGAINACLMCEKSFNKAIRLWKKLNYNMIFDNKEIDSSKIVTSYAKNILINGGMNPVMLEDNLRKYINVNKIYRSNIDYGLVTVNVTKHKAMNLQKKDIPKDEFLDYVMASSTCFPAFQMKEINNDKYIDGGYSDNLPINLAIKMGADKIIAIDLRKIGLKKTVNKKNMDITYITPKGKIAKVLEFDGKHSKIDIDYGYNDTLKTFNYLDGNIYTFKHNNLKKFIDKNKETYNKLLNKLITNKLVIKNLLKILYINSSDKIFDMLISSIDYLGEIFDIDDSKIYSINNYNKILLNKFNDNYYTNFSKFKLHELLESDKSIYYIYIKIEECIEKNNYDDLSKAIPLFPKQFISALYLYMLKIKDS